MLGEGIIKLLDQTYQPSSINETKYRGIDLAFKTDGEGRPVLVFIGKKTGPGKIRGERYVRTTTTSRGKMRDRWEKKGKATP